MQLYVIPTGTHKVGLYALMSCVLAVRFSDIHVVTCTA